MYSPDPGGILDPEKGLHEEEDRPTVRFICAAPLLPPHPTRTREETCAPAWSRAQHPAPFLFPRLAEKYIPLMYIVVGIGKRSTSITRLTRDKEEARLDEVSMEHEPPLRKIQLDGSKNKFFLPFRAISFRLFSTPPSRSICFLGPRPMIAVYYVSCNREFSLPFSRSWQMIEIIDKMDWKNRSSLSTIVEIGILKKSS